MSTPGEQDTRCAGAHAGRASVRNLEKFRERLTHELVVEKVSETQTLRILLAATGVASNADSGLTDGRRNHQFQR
jgi:hypothetical protein